MTANNLALLAVTLFLNFAAVFCVKFTPLRKADALKEKIKLYFISSKKQTAYFVAMFVLNIAVCEMLALFYTDNSLIFNLKRIFVLNVLWIAAYFDFKSYRIPNKLILLGLAYRAVLIPFELLFERDSFLITAIYELIAAAAMLIISLLCMLIVKNGLGMGDAKLFIVMGLLLGVSGMMSAMFVTMIVIFLISIVLIIAKKKTRKDFIPFAPGILIGSIISIFLTGN